MSDISQDAGKAALSTAEQLIQEGLEKGVQEGLQKGIKINLHQNIVKLIKSGALPLSEIARILEVPLGTIEKIAQELPPAR